MASAPVQVLSPIHALYSQHDFVPYEVYERWYSSGLAVGLALEWLQFPAELASAYLELLGTTAEAHLSSIAYITVEEHEELISVQMVGNTRVTPVSRSKMRQLLLAAGCVIGVVRPLPLRRRPLPLVHLPRHLPWRIIHGTRPTSTTLFARGRT